MKNLSDALPHYLEILKKKRKPKFQSHKNLLNSKIKEAFNLLKNCELCERKCLTNRYEELGWCKVGKEMKVSSCFVHIGEEYFLVPSFTIFFISCNFSCQFCQNYTISQRVEQGVKISEEELAMIIDEHSNCKNVNFVGGEPTPYLPFILKTLSFVKSDIPVVWNSNFYMTEKSMEQLHDIVDVYLSDWKYGNDKCAKRLSKVDNYFKIVSRNHQLAFNDSELAIRHLVLPNHFDCCTKPIFDFIAGHFKDKVIINIMDQYRPEFKASEHKDINRRIYQEEFKNAINYAEKSGLNFTT